MVPLKIFYWYYLRYGAQVLPERPEQIRSQRLLRCAVKKELSEIPVKSLKTEDKEVQGDDERCAICIEPYKVSETLKSLPCRHDFHEDCIDQWLLLHLTCPMCKMDFLKHYSSVLTSDNSHEETGSEDSSRAALPEELMLSPDELVPSPDEPVPSPDELVPSPDELVPLPDELVLSPDELVPSPDELVPSPDELVPSAGAGSSTTQERAASRDPKRPRLSF